jgi:hypothetical protein
MSALVLHPLTHSSNGSSNVAPSSSGPYLHIPGNLSVYQVTPCGQQMHNQILIGVKELMLMLGVARTAILQGPMSMLECLQLQQGASLSSL